MSVASVKEIHAFLQQCKRMVSKGRLHFVNRRESLDTLASFGLEITHVAEILLLLTITHYTQGPMSDRDVEFPGSMYVFGYYLENTELYIKLKCDEDRGCVCISFHPSRWPLTYPYSERGE